MGKSTLFNRISRRKLALVDDLPGLTRDRNYSRVEWDRKTFTLVDTGGYVEGEGSIIEDQMREQVLLAMDEADILLFVTDGKTGLHPEDRTLADLLRRTAKPVFFVVNKIDGHGQEKLAAEFYELGAEKLHPVSAAHGYGMVDLIGDVCDLLPEEPGDDIELEEVEEDDKVPSEIRVSVLGRPNVGKSTLVNRILGEQRVIVSPIPGTTRDAVDTPFVRGGQQYVLIDTAGIRRKGKTREKLEKISIIKALQSIERSHVTIILVDAVEGVTDQDLHVGGYIQERHRACVIAINKWDAVEKDEKARKRLMEEVRERYKYLPFAPIIPLSAMTGKGVGKLLPTVAEVFRQYNTRVTTGLLNRSFEAILQRHEPPMSGGRRTKIYYATQTSIRPPTFVLFCNQPDAIHFSYQRYLTNQFREAFGLDKTPLRLLYRGRRRES